MKPDVKKIIITNLPYLPFVWLFGKVGEAWRPAAGMDASQKMLHFMDSLAAAFANGLPSFHPFDLCIGIVGAALVRLTVYLKGKNAKKYRHGMEYGSARWFTMLLLSPSNVSSCERRAYNAVICPGLYVFAVMCSFLL